MNQLLTFSIQMKKILWIIGLGGVLSACENVLNTAPSNAITDVSAFASPERCLLVMHGVYDAAQGSYYVTGAPDNRGYPFGAANISQGDTRGEDMINIQSFFQVTYQASYGAASPNCAAHWKGLYVLINKANIAIAGFRNAGETGILTSELSRQYEAESRFLRALSHHELLIHWARPYRDSNGRHVGIPYRENPINSSSAVNTILKTPRMRVDTVYAKILADLDYAEANLPENIFTYRASKAAAIALKLRIKLHMGDWNGVISEGNKLVPAVVNPAAPAGVVSPVGKWSLTPSPDGPFQNNNSAESIFSIKNDPLDAPTTNGALFRAYGAANLTGRGLVALSPILYNDTDWLCDDKRRTLLTAPGINSVGTQSYFTTKYRDNTGWGDYAPQIRYAEVLLSLAEAEARVASGISGRALDLLNTVRNRSLASPETQAYTTASFADRISLVKAILKERRIEFLAEGKRWSDISRLATDGEYGTGGIPAKAVNGAAGLAIYGCGLNYTPGQNAIPYQDFRFIWPIPESEISQNQAIEQNPLY